MYPVQTVPGAGDVGRTMTDNAVSAASYGGAAVSVIFGLTLTDWGVIVGIITAVVTLVCNVLYRIREDRRSQQRHELDIAKRRQEMREETDYA